VHEISERNEFLNLFGVSNVIGVEGLEHHVYLNEPVSISILSQVNGVVSLRSESVNIERVSRLELGGGETRIVESPFGLGIGNEDGNLFWFNTHGGSKQNSAFSVCLLAWLLIDLLFNFIHVGNQL